MEATKSTYLTREERITLAREQLDRAERYCKIDAEETRQPSAAGQRVGYMARESADRAIDYAIAILQNKT